MAHIKQFVDLPRVEKTRNNAVHLPETFRNPITIKLQWVLLKLI